jgi:methylated-DNA-[protein]-cysteine S-methyltransferase
MLRVDEVPTPVGAMVFAVRGDAVCGLVFENYWAGMEAQLHQRFRETSRRERDPAGVSTKLRAYLAGQLTALDDIEVETGGTPFQRSVWEALRQIPAGATISYAQLAANVGRPTAMRAVGAANGANPVSIIIPCHRVVRSDGDLCGYGGGRDRKRWLIDHEQTAVGALAGTPLGRVRADGRLGR